jgi:hypothetical protein
MSQLSLLATDRPRPTGSLTDRADAFCRTTPYRTDPYAKRNWGGALHSLCSYQGKLKPSIAHFLVGWFTEPGDRVLDPMSGVGTIPLEARRLGRTAVGGDLSPLAASVTRAKLEPFDPGDVEVVLDRLEKAIVNGSMLNALEKEEDLDFGLNGPIREYFHPETLREVVIARRFFRDQETTAAVDVVRSSLLHILHGNRPYALSRRSHPVTPFAPSGDFEYRGLVDRLQIRLGRIVPELVDLASSSPSGMAMQRDFREIALDEPVDAVITSPPFAQSLRFWSMNWLRLWFTGWDRADFSVEPERFLDVQQRASMAPYAEFAEAMHRATKPGGLMILHLGETAGHNMAETVKPQIEPWFDVVFAGREDVADTESHGLRDKGATRAHWYLFALRRP